MKLLVLLTLVSVTLADFTCTDPSSRKGTYVTNGQSGNSGKQCAALVQELCSGVGHTTKWKAGKKLKDDCQRGKETIKKFTAIATFAGPNGAYNGGSYRHTAIFSHCVYFANPIEDGILVWDQWVGRPTNLRLIKWHKNGGRNQNDADNYYTISH